MSFDFSDKIPTDEIPEAKYTRFGEKIRQTIPGPMQCSMACGGKNCKWENPNRWSYEDQAIKGVFSSWVLDDVVAMSRPSTKVIKEYKIIEQFKENNICSIINLQRRGEHASCGPPLEKDSLFTYNPQEFMDNDIFFYNFGWKDYGVTSMNTILDMVKVMSFALSEGKVAVHCHAGLGRTGVLVACYLVYSQRMQPAIAIRRIRDKRSNSIQTRGQIACIHEFWQFLRPFRVIFPQVAPNSKRLTLDQFLHRQNQMLHGSELRQLRFIPKIVYVVTNRLTSLMKNEEEPKSRSLRRCNTIHQLYEVRIDNEKSSDQLSFHFPTSASASDGELNKCLDEVEPIGLELQKSWSNGINKNLIEETSFSDDEHSQKNLDENLERNSNNNNKNERKTSSENVRNSVSLALNENDLKSDEARNELNRKKHMQIGLSPAVLPTGSPIKTYRNTNVVQNRRFSLKRENSSFYEKSSTSDDLIFETTSSNEQEVENTTFEASVSIHETDKQKIKLYDKKYLERLEAETTVGTASEEEHLKSIEINNCSKLDTVDENLEKNFSETIVIEKSTNITTISNLLADDDEDHKSQKEILTPITYKTEQIFKDTNNFQISDQDDADDAARKKQLDINQHVKARSWKSLEDLSLSVDDQLTKTSVKALYIADAVAYKLQNNEFIWEKVYARQVSINTNKDCWKELETDEDVFALASLMWSWLEHLEDSVLKKEEILQIIEVMKDSTANCKTFENILKTFGKSISSTVSCILDFITSFPPLPRETAQAIVQRSVVAMTTVRRDRVFDEDQINTLVMVVNKYCDLKYSELGKTRFSPNNKASKLTSKPSARFFMKSEILQKLWSKPPQNVLLQDQTNSLSMIHSSVIVS